MRTAVSLREIGAFVAAEVYSRRKSAGEGTCIRSAFAYADLAFGIAGLIHIDLLDRLDHRTVDIERIAV